MRWNASPNVLMQKRLFAGGDPLVIDEAQQNHDHRQKPGAGSMEHPSHINVFAR